MTFDFQPARRGETVAVRPLGAGDLEALFAAASDPLIWAGHPARDRHERAAFAPYFAFLLASGTALAVLEAETGRIVGCSRYYLTPKGEPSIGFTFLERALWGGPANFELKTLMLEHLFESTPEAWFHIDPTNIRSQRAVEKLGAVFQREEVLDLGTGEARWCCYCLLEKDWRGRLLAFQV